MNDNSIIEHFSSELLKVLYSLLNPKFISFVQRKERDLEVLDQIGDSKYVIEHFDEKNSEQIFNMVTEQDKLISLKMNGGEQFVFLPVIDKSLNKAFTHGIIVAHLSDPSQIINKETSTVLLSLCRLAASYMSRASVDKSEINHSLGQVIKSELKLASEIHHSMSNIEGSKNLLFSVLEDEDTTFTGNIWWVSDLGADISIIFFAQAEAIKGLSGAPAAMLSGILLGEMNSIKTKAELCLKPSLVLNYLSKQFNNVYKKTGISFNAWYGVFNVEARKIKFSSANHPDPYVIGPELQVSKLTTPDFKKGHSLGIGLNPEFSECDLYIAKGSRLVICNTAMLDSVSALGSKYDQSWFPQLLETYGTLPLNEMKSSLKGILSGNGTAKNSSRLALLLEMSS